VHSHSDKSFTIHPVVHIVNILLLLFDIEISLLISRSKTFWMGKFVKFLYFEINLSEWANMYWKISRIDTLEKFKVNVIKMYSFIET